LFPDQSRLRLPSSNARLVPRKTILFCAFAEEKKLRGKC